MQLNMHIKETSNGNAVCTCSVFDDLECIKENKQTMPLQDVGQWVQDAVQMFEGLSGADIVPPYPPAIEFNLDTDPIIEQALGVTVMKADVIDVEPRHD